MTRSLSHRVGGPAVLPALPHRQRRTAGQQHQQAAAAVRNPGCARESVPDTGLRLRFSEEPQHALQRQPPQEREHHEGHQPAQPHSRPRYRARALQAARIAPTTGLPGAIRSAPGYNSAIPPAPRGWPPRRGRPPADRQRPAAAPASPPRRTARCARRRDGRHAPRGRGAGAIAHRAGLDRHARGHGQLQFVEPRRPRRGPASPTAPRSRPAAAVAARSGPRAGPGSAAIGTARARERRQAQRQVAQVGQRPGRAGCARAPAGDPGTGPSRRCGRSGGRGPRPAAPAA